MENNGSEKKQDAGSSREASCGLVMPISSGLECTAEHWAEVKGIITSAVESIEEFDFETSMVNESGAASIIQKRIISRLYKSDVVVCDVSTLNANVMFELGMRLAFDKATVIIKDDSTDFIFDTSGFEHLIYPRDLRFGKINEFKERLSKKVLDTYKSSLESDYSAFLGQYGEYRVRGLDEYSININGLNELLSINRSALDEVRDIARSVRSDAINFKKDILLSTKLSSIESIENINENEISRYYLEKNKKKIKSELSGEEERNILDMFTQNRKDD